MMREVTSSTTSSSHLPPPLSSHLLARHSSTLLGTARHSSAAKVAGAWMHQVLLATPPLPPLLPTSSATANAHRQSRRCLWHAELVS